MEEDHLDKETSISVELTETGVKAKAKSRAIAAFDRLAGSVFDMGSAWVERKTSLTRAKTEGERQLIAATVEFGVERLMHDQEFAKRALENHFSTVAKAQINKDEVVRAALEDLRQDPPTSEQTASGPETLDESFMNRLEHYAEGASKEDLRQRWGKVLAAEVRQPGTFSAKVLRAIDEIDPDAAKLFTQLQQYRIKNTLVVPIMPELTFAERLLLVGSDLIVDPGQMGHLSYLSDRTDDNNEQFWMYYFGNFSFAFRKNVTPAYSNKTPVSGTWEAPGVPIYILTDVGRAISTIIPSDENAAGMALLEKVRAFMPETPVGLYKQVDDRMVPLPV